MTRNCHPPDIAWYPIELASSLLAVSPRTVWRYLEILVALEIKGVRRIPRSGGVDSRTFTILQDYRKFIIERKVQDAADVAILEKYGQI